MYFTSEIIKGGSKSKPLPTQSFIEVDPGGDAVYSGHCLQEVAVRIEL